MILGYDIKIWTFFLHAIYNTKKKWNRAQHVSINSSLVRFIPNSRLWKTISQRQSQTTEPRLTCSLGRLKCGPHKIYLPDFPREDWRVAKNVTWKLGSHWLIIAPLYQTNCSFISSPKKKLLFYISSCARAHGGWLFLSLIMVV